MCTYPQLYTELHFRAGLLVRGQHVVPCVAGEWRYSAVAVVWVGNCQLQRYRLSRGSVWEMRRLQNWKWILIHGGRLQQQQYRVF